MGSDDSGITPMREAAIQLHELYIELKAAGFKRSEAMELLAKVLATSVMDTVNDDDGNESE